MTEPKAVCSQDKLSLLYAALLTRLWLAVRALQTGIEKFAGNASSEQLATIDGAPNDYGLTTAATVKHYALENLHGVPPPLMKSFQSEPLMSDFFLKVFDVLLAPALLLLGIMILFGIASRTSLLLLGLLYISLTWGLILLGEPGNAGVAWLGTHMLLIAAALVLTPHDRLRLVKKW